MIIAGEDDRITDATRRAMICLVGLQLRHGLSAETAHPSLHSVDHKAPIPAEMKDRHTLAFEEYTLSFDVFGRYRPDRPHGLHAVGLARCDSAIECPLDELVLALTKQPHLMRQVERAEYECIDTGHSRDGFDILDTSEALDDNPD